jgi:hypothetical protein
LASARVSDAAISLRQTQGKQQGRQVGGSGVRCRGFQRRVSHLIHSELRDVEPAPEAALVLASCHEANLPRMDRHAMVFA